MNATATTFRPTTPPAAPGAGELNPATSAAPPPGDARRAVGEIVGNVFYGTLLRQMHASNLKGAYFHGGRGEEAFQGQLVMELARRMGHAPNDPLANRIYHAIARRLSPAIDGPPEVSGETKEARP
jgi:hypothetical protein